MILKLITVIMPWPIKRYILEKYFGFNIHPTARIGLAWIYPYKLVMEAGCKIDHFTVAINLDKIIMKTKSKIGRSNWITGFKTNTSSSHFAHQANREAVLIIGDKSAITKNHHLDCTNKIEIGRFTTIAGYQSQFLTHSVDVFENRQDSNPIMIGDYCFVGTNVTVLGGATLPSKCVLGAKSLLNKSFKSELMLIAGVPAKEIKELPADTKYFLREEGFVI